MYKLTLPFILYFINDKYRKLKPELLNYADEFNWQEIKNIAIKNKIFYFLILEIKRIKPEWISKFTVNGDSFKDFVQQFNLVKDTIKFIDSAFRNNGIDYLVVKTYKDIPFLTQDIDIFVKKESFQKAINILKEQGSQKLSISFVNQMVFKILYQPEEIYTKTGLLKIDMYRDLSWIRTPSFDYEFIWDKPREINMDNVKFKVPNYEADLISLIAHSLFWHGDIILLDFLYIDWLLEKPLNWSLLLEQTEKYGWKTGFLNTISEIKRIKEILYSKDAEKLSLRFPYRFSLCYLLINYQNFIFKNKKFFEPLIWLQVLFQLSVLFKYRLKIDS